MRYFIIRYLGHNHYHAEPLRSILQADAIFLSQSAAEANLPSAPYALDRNQSYFDNYFAPKYIQQTSPWYIQEVNEDHLISMALSHSLYHYPNWPLRVIDDIQLVFRDPDNPDVVNFWDGRRVQSMKPGRFLNRFHKNLNKVQVEYYARWWIDRQRPPREISSTITFARTEQEMIDAYARGPNSCMYRKQAPRAYAGGDFALALLEANSGEVSARVLVNEKTKTFGRIYSDEDEGEDLEELLRQMGYQSIEENNEGFEGAHFLQLPIDTDEYGEEVDQDKHIAFAMPYLDRNVYLDPLTWTATRNFDSQITLSSDFTSGAMYVFKDTCKICGKLAMIQNSRHRVFHEDFGPSTALCPEHRISERYTDTYNGGIYYGTPAYIDTAGRKYSRDTIGSQLYASSTGVWYLEFQDPAISIDGVLYSTSEATPLGAHYNERYNKWTLKSDQELREEYEPEYIQRKVRKANSDATYNRSWYSSIANRFEYGRRPSAFGDAEVQETSGLHNGGDIYRTIPSVPFSYQACG